MRSKAFKTSLIAVRVFSFKVPSSAALHAPSNGKSDRSLSSVFGPRPGLCNKTASAAASSNSFRANRK